MVFLEADTDAFPADGRRHTEVGKDPSFVYHFLYILSIVPWLIASYIRYFAPTVLISCTIYRCNFTTTIPLIIANNYKFNLSIIAWILHILHRLDEYKRVASFRNIHSTTFELIISKLFFLKYQQIDIATYIIHIYWRKYQLFSLSNFYSAEWFLSILKDFEGKLWKKIFKNFILCWKFYQNNLSGFQNFWKKQNIP